MSAGTPAPPHPGPRPDTFAFPFAESRLAQQAIGDLVDELRHLVAVHELAAARARPGWEGQHRHEFERWLRAHLDEVRRHVAALTAQLDLIGARTTVAHRRFEDGQEAQQRWRRQLLLHQMAREQPPGADAASAVR